MNALEENQKLNTHFKNLERTKNSLVIQIEELKKTEIDLRSTIIDLEHALEAKNRNADSNLVKPNEDDSGAHVDSPNWRSGKSSNASTEFDEMNNAVETNDKTDTAKNSIIESLEKSLNFSQEQANGYLRLIDSLKKERDDLLIKLSDLQRIVDHLESRLNLVSANVKIQGSSQTERHCTSMIEISDSSHLLVFNEYLDEDEWVGYQTKSAQIPSILNSVNDQTEVVFKKRYKTENVDAETHYSDQEFSAESVVHDSFIVEKDLPPEPIISGVEALTYTMIGTWVQCL
jgi:regulator of sigma D